MTNDILNQEARYRVTADWFPVLGMAQRKGFEFPYAGWLPNHGTGVEPITEAAKKVLAYQTKHLHDGWKPMTPWNYEYGSFYLPAVTKRDNSSQWLLTIPDAQTQPGMPRYRMTENPWPRAPFEHDPRFPHANPKKGSVLTVLSWPDGMTDFEAANEAAELVTAYYLANAHNPKLLTCPWDDFTEGLFLPELPPHRERVNDQDVNRYVTAPSIPVKPARRRRSLRRVAA